MARLLAALLSLGATFWLPGSLLAQQLRGEVRDATTGEPVADVLVRSDSTGAVTVTDSDGGFVLGPLVPGVQTLTIQALGYETAVVPVEVPSSDRVRVELHPHPLDVEGFRVTAESFAARLEAAKAVLDRRLAVLPGDVRAADAARIRPYDGGHDRDPWRFMSDVMRLQPVQNEDRVRVRGAQARIGDIQTPEVYVDDQRVWLLDLVLMPLSEVCRVEFYTPRPGDDNPIKVPTQLRAYTCAFLADVAGGFAELSPHLPWGDLIAGPGGAGGG